MKNKYGMIYLRVLLALTVLLGVLKATGILGISWLVVLAPAIVTVVGATIGSLVYPFWRKK